jgi:hypothetical protein
LDELKRRSRIVEPPIETMLERYGFADEIGVNDYGAAAVPVEVAAQFLGAYEDATASRAGQRSAYENFLNERRVAIVRAEIEVEHEAEVQRQANAVVDEDAPTFSEWKAENGDV